MTTETLEQGCIIGNFFKINKLLGKGSFGNVYNAKDTRTGAGVAIKTELKNSKFPQLLYEAKILEQFAGVPGFPDVYWFHEHASWNVLVMKLLKISLEEDRLQAGGRLSLDNVKNIAVQGLGRLKQLHKRGWAYRDIKPDNFMWHKSRLYIIDFGLCKQMYYSNGAHIPRRTGKTLTGTPRYASIRAHEGEEQSRRDDVESFVYMLIYLVNGILPWQKLPPPLASTRDKYKHIAACKRAIPPNTLCANLPHAFKQTLAYAKELAFEAMPDYDFLENLWSL
jgi:serine/threonine protein kinase